MLQPNCTFAFSATLAVLAGWSVAIAVKVFEDRAVRRGVGAEAARVPHLVFDDVHGLRVGGDALGRRVEDADGGAAVAKVLGR